MSPKTRPQKTADSLGLSEAERLALKERLQEQKGKAKGEEVVLAKIAEMPQPDRFMAERLHTLIKAIAPSLSPRLWYGMPAYAHQGKVICFFQSAQKFKTRYATLGFSDAAQLDQGEIWPVAFALKAWTAEVEAQVSELIRKAVIG